MPAIENEYVTVAEAAALLRVAPSTVRRWIREGDVAAYRLGQRRIALRRGDPASLITPVRAMQERESHVPAGDDAKPRRLTSEEKQRGLEALDRIFTLSEEIMARRGGEPVC